MQESSSSSNKPEQASIDNKQTGQDPEENSDVLGEQQCNRFGRRPALTPESHNIEPIRQVEIQEKMSSLTMASDGQSSLGESSHSQSGG